MGTFVSTDRTVMLMLRIMNVVAEVRVIVVNSNGKCGCMARLFELEACSFNKIRK